MKTFFATLLIASLAFTSLHAQGTVKVIYDGPTASVIIPDDVKGVTYTVSGAHVVINSTTITQEYTYSLSGASDNGSLTFNGNYKFTMSLDGLQLTNAKGGAAIDVECGKRVSVILSDGSTNTLADSPLGAQKAALYFKGHPEFKGSGTLNVTGNLKHAICAKEYIELKKTTGFINILGAVSDGIHCGKGNPDWENNYFQMDGGTVDIRDVQGDGIDADDYGTIRINDGAVSITVGHAATALKADSIVSIKGGVVNLAVTGDDSEGIRARHTVDITGGQTSIIVTGNGSTGIKGKRYTAGSTVLNGGFVNIGGGTTEIHVLGDAFVNEEGIKIPCTGIRADADLSMTNGEVDVYAMGLETLPVDVAGNDDRSRGTLRIIRTPWHTNAFDYQYDMTLYVVVEADGQRVDDYSTKAVGAFIGEECVGYGVFEDTNYGIMRVRSNSTEQQEVTFKTYDYNTALAFDATADRDITFNPSASIGSPSDPVVIGYTSRGLLGDVNLDGMINITDVSLMVNYILSHATDHFYFPNADIDGSNTVNITDVTLVINIILNPGG
ncbi:MAG: carbohydrate-binding domain-containing protein [Prevotella sp.]|nr:carbohydrate-binding domain-containing protein [Prevotella sp.]